VFRQEAISVNRRHNIIPRITDHTKSLYGSLFEWYCTIPGVTLSAFNPTISLGDVGQDPISDYVAHNDEVDFCKKEMAKCDLSTLNEVSLDNGLARECY
jgi:hypothetical protein